VLEEAKSRTGQGKPIMILMHTEMGYGVDFMVGSHKWHGIAPNDEQLKLSFRSVGGNTGRLLIQPPNSPEGEKR
jgi:transketolase